MPCLDTTLRGVLLSLIFPADAGQLPVVWTHMSRQDGLAVAALLTVPCALMCVTDADWERDLSPWPAPKAFRKGRDFSGGAPAHLERLLALLSEAEALLPGGSGERCLAGYSLAGLFALWAGCSCDAFRRIGSFSGSLWFDGFLPWAQAHPLVRPDAALALSLGDREKKAREPRMARVEDCTRRLAELLGQNHPVSLRMESGGHFDQVEARIARGITDMLLLP